MASFLQSIWDELKKFLIPIIIGIVTIPILRITKFEGIIFKDPFIDSTQSLVYPLTCTKDSLTNIVFHVSVLDSNTYEHSGARMLLKRVPPDRNWSLSNCTRYGNTTRLEKYTKVTKLVNAQYELSAPLNVHGALRHPVTEDHFLIRFYKANAGGGKTIYPDTLKYQWYHWVWFNSWLTALLIVGVLLCVQFIYHIIKKKKP